VQERGGRKLLQFAVSSAGFAFFAEPVVR